MTRHFFHASISTIAIALASSLAHASAQDTDSGDDDTLVQVQIVVTGTRTASRTALETAVPVDIFPVSELNATGRVELNQILAATVPSFNFNQTAINDGTDIIRPATLRGLSPDQTLVLVNSKRRHSTALVNINGSVGRGSAAVDLNSIPASAIGSIQVLRDGASAQYGSDAIAGVINVLLREADSGGQVSMRYGAHVTDPDGLERSIVDGGTTTVGGWAGYQLTDNGFVTVSAEYSDRSPTNRAGLDPRQQYNTDSDGNLLAAGTTDPRELTFNRLNHRYGNGNAENLSFFLNSAITLNNDWEVYATAGYQAREADSPGFYRRSGDATRDFRSTPRSLTEIYPDGFLPVIAGDVSDYSFSGGLRGIANDWDFDISATFGTNKLDYSITNTLNASLGPNSPTTFDAGALKFEQTVFNADITRRFATLFPGTTTLSFGIEYRDETFTITAGSPDSYRTGSYRGVLGKNFAAAQDPENDGIGFAGGSQVFAGFTPQSAIKAGRDNIGAYADIEWEPNAATLLSAAIRYENYSDFGSATTWKLSGRYDVSPVFALRGAASTGFRAPSLQQQFFTATSTNFIDNVPNEVGTFPATSAAAVALGGGQLDAETATNLSVGLVITLDDSSFITIDAYQIDIEDQIFLSENLSGPEVNQVLEDAGVTGVDRVRFFQNGIETRTRGFDIVARRLFDFGAPGTLGLSAAFNHSKVDVKKVPTNQAIPTLTLFSRDRQLTLEESAPGTKFVLSADWTYRDAIIRGRATRYGSVIDPSNNPANDFTLKADWVIDIAADLAVSDQLNIGLGIDNVLDEYPTLTPDNQNFNGIFPYSSRSPYGFSGRFMYVRASYNW